MEILLCTLNAKYIHCAFGLRYLYANLGEFQSRAEILEFTTNQATRDIVEDILSRSPKIVGFGIYIWNTRQTADVISTLKRLRPEIIIVLGGPEVSFETESQPICQMADYTVQGEADFLFHDFCRDYFEHAKLPARKWISGPLPEITEIKLPYSHYSDDDVRNRLVYVEASRGCPYKCEYCLSSLDKSVRNFDLENFLTQMDGLVSRGVKQFKFVDRTFNLSIPISTRILEFFLERMEHGLFLHFEMVPDRLPTELRALIKKFPAGSLQFEVGIQTWNPEVGKLVSRRQDYGKIAENFAFLNGETKVHTHGDLIAGLPSETLESFAKGFDALASLGPDEIQVGILKRLKGTPIVRHDREWEMIYQEQPPFQIISTKTMGFGVIQRISRFANFWDQIANSGNFKETMLIIRELSEKRAEPSLFWEFDELSQYLYKRHTTNGIALINLVQSTWSYLQTRTGVDVERARACLIRDYTVSPKRSLPAFLRGDDHGRVPSPGQQATSSGAPKRQAQHLR